MRGKPAVGPVRRPSAGGGNWCLIAMRLAVIERVTSFMQAARYEGRGNEYHVGHDWETGESFKELADRFVREACGGSWSSLGICKSKVRAPPGHFPWVLEDDKLEEWREFHRRHAVLRMERAEDNVRAPK